MSGHLNHIVDPNHIQEADTDEVGVKNHCISKAHGSGVRIIMVGRTPDKVGISSICNIGESLTTDAKFIPFDNAVA